MLYAQELFLSLDFVLAVLVVVVDGGRGGGGGDEGHFAGIENQPFEPASSLSSSAVLVAEERRKEPRQRLVGDREGWATKKRMRTMIQWPGEPLGRQLGRPPYRLQKVE